MQAIRGLLSTLNALQILYEDNHLLVVDKPAGIATMGTLPSVPTVARAAADYLKAKYQKPGKVFVGVVSRLDSLVSGVLVFARTSKAASRLSEQFREKTPSKRYIAMVEDELTLPDWLQLEDWVIKDESQQRMKIVDPSFRGNAACQQASLRVRTLAATASASLVEVDLLTGRKHQIRLQLAAAGHAILGDRKYGASRKFSPGIALHCVELKILHPTKREPMTFASLPGSQWHRVAPQIMERGLAKLKLKQGG